MWRILTMRSGRETEIIGKLLRAGVTREEIFAPQIVRERPNMKARLVVVARRGGKPVTARPTRRYVSRMFPGYVFVDCGPFGPAAAQNIGAALRAIDAEGVDWLRLSSAHRPYAAVPYPFIRGLRAQCVRGDDPPRKPGNREGEEIWTDTRLARVVNDPIRQAVAERRALDLLSTADALSGMALKLAISDPADVARALSDLDEKGKINVIATMFGCARMIEAPRGLVDVARRAS